MKDTITRIAEIICEISQGILHGEDRVRLLQEAYWQFDKLPNCPKEAQVRILNELDRRCAPIHNKEKVHAGDAMPDVCG